MLTLSAIQQKPDKGKEAPEEEEKAPPFSDQKSYNFWHISVLLSVSKKGRDFLWETVFAENNWEAFVS